MKQWDSVAIVGVGLLGGSIGLALRNRGLAQQVVGVGRKMANLRTAQAMGAITSATTNLARGVATAQLVIVCTPVGRIVQDVRAVAAACPPDTLITDVGSTKAEIVSQLNGGLERNVRFIGSHPLAGGEKSGAAAASQDLLEGRWVIVTPTARTRREDLRAIGDLWTALGANVVPMSAARHDKTVAATSHLPHLVASALAAATPEECLPMAARGWRDTTRVASGDPDMWRQIFMANRGHVLAALRRYERTLAGLRTAIEREDGKKLERILTEAKQNRDALGS